MDKKINNMQLLLLLITFVLSTADIFLPSIVAKFAGPDSWFSAIIAAAFGLVVVYVVVALSQEYNNKSLTDIFENIYGKYLGKAFGLLFVIIIIFSNAVVLRELGEMLSTIFLPGIPIVVITGLTGLLNTYAVYKGIEVISRINQVLLPYGIFVLGFVILFGLYYADPTRFLPIFENGILPSVRGSFPLWTWFADLIIIVVLIPYISNPNKVLRFSILAVIVLGVSLFIGTFTILILTPEVAKDLIYSPYQIVESISIERVINFDVFVMGVWLTGIFIKSSVFQFVAVDSLNRLFNFRDTKIIILPISIITVIFSINEFENVIDLSEYLSKTAYLLIIPIFFIIPLISLAITKVKKVLAKSD